MTISLRALEDKDLPGMLAWMQDSDVIRSFRFNFVSADRVAEFIRNSILDKDNRHFAIVDAHDEYLGTISLKNIDNINRHAEYAIVLRKEYWGKGIAYLASNLLIEYATSLGLHKIYLNVIETNLSAIRLYKKLGFVESGIYKDHILKDGSYVSLKYFEKILG